MTTRTRRIWVTAGTTGWARAPYDPDTDPNLPPDTEHEENTDMANDHTLTPADVAARCRILECGVTVSGGNYKITPPAGATTEDGSRPSVVHIPADPDFRSKADRTLSVRNLRHNGVDVLQERDWSSRTADDETDPAPEIPKMTVQGPRPTASWSKVPDEPAAPAELEVSPADLDRSDAIISMLAAEMARIVEPIAEDLAKLAARVGNLESGPRAVASSSGHARRLEQLDESVGSLARRVALTEGKTDTAITGLTRANDAVKALVDKVGGNAARATNLGSEIVSVRQRLDALETSVGASAPTGPDPRVVRAGELAELVVELMDSLPPRMTVRLGSIVESLELDDEDVRIMRNGVLSGLAESGRILRTGKGSGMKYGKAPEAES